ncbi:MAG: hypothetical protein SOZ04_00450 [Bacilli bacterium]|nr:hypothetical protein [Bacilli bacterium]
MKKDKVFNAVFCGIIGGVCLYIPVHFMLVHIGVVTKTSNDNQVVFEPISEKNIGDKLSNKVNAIKTRLENEITNSFPFYNSLNGLYQNFNYYMNSFFYKEVPLKTNSDNEYIFYNKENDFYYLENQYSKDELDKRLDMQVAMFNKLANLDIDMYLYFPTRYELTKLKDNNLNSYVDIFKDKLSSKIKVANMDITSLEQYKNYFYKTDHHWNMNGALAGYYDIMDILGKVPVDNLEVVNKRERKFYGSMAKSVLNNKTYDYILDVDKKLDYDVLVNGKQASEVFKPRQIRLDRDYLYYDYYVQYFNGQYGEICYDYHKDNEENLLILSDSYAWQIDYLIASSFNKTYVVNLRYDKWKKGDLNLEEYMKERNIKKVLFLYEGGSMMFDQYNYNLEGRIK